MFTSDRQKRLFSALRTELETTAGDGNGLVIESYRITDWFEPSLPERMVPAALFGRTPPSYDNACLALLLAMAGAAAISFRTFARSALLLRSRSSRFPHPLPFDRNSVEPYALVRVELWRRHATPKPPGHKERLPEELVDRVTGKGLGIDERDLMIASIAIQYNLVLATADRNAGMVRIEDAAATVEKSGKPVHLAVENWSL